MSFCPNKSHPNWKELVEKVGEDKAYEEYILNGFKLLSQKGIKQLEANTLESFQFDKNKIEATPENILKYLQKEGIVNKDSYVDGNYYIHKGRVFEDKGNDANSEFQKNLRHIEYINKQYRDIVQDNIIEIVKTKNSAYVKLNNEAIAKLNNKRQEEKIPDEQLDSKIKEFLNKLGIEVNSLDSIKDANGNVIPNAVARAKYSKTQLKAIIDIVENKKGLDTLTEEATHFLVWMLRGTPLYKSMMMDITKYPEYKEVLAEYKDVYKSDIEFKEEAITKIITKRIVNYSKNGNPLSKEEYQDLYSRFNRWFNKVIDFIKQLLNSYKVDAYDLAAMKLLFNDTSDLSLNNINENILAYQIGKDTELDSLVNKLTNENNISKIDDKYYDGDFQFSKRVTQVTEEQYGKPEDLTREQQIYGEFMREFGTDGHEDMVNAIKREIELRETGSYNTALETKLGEESYSKIVTFAKSFVNAYPQNAKFIFEQPIGDKKAAGEKGIAGTLDLLVVFRNPKTNKLEGHVYDWKFIKYEKGREFINKTKRKNNLMQLGIYKQMLKDVYGVNVTKARIMPIKAILHKTEEGLKRGTVEMTSMDYVDGEIFTNQIALENEKTGIETIDYVLENLIKQRDSIKEQSVTKEQKPAKQRRLESLENLIQKTILTKNINFFLHDANYELGNLTSNLTNNNLIKAIKLNHFYRGIKFASLKHEIGEEEYKKLLPEINLFRETLDELSSMLENKLKDSAKEIALGTGIDLESNSFEDLGVVEKYLNTLSAQDNPYLKALHTLIQEAKIKIKEANDTKYNQIEKAIEDVLKSTSDKENPFNWMIKKDKNGNLRQIAKFKIRDNIKKARENKDYNYLKEVFEFDDVRYTEALKDNIMFWKEYYKNYENKDEIIKNNIKNFQINNDPRESSKALLNKNNYYLKIKEKQEYYTDEYNTIQNNEAYKKFYDLFNETVRESKEWLDVDLDSNFIPQVSKSYIEELKANGITSIRNIGKMFVDSLEAKQKGYYQEVNSTTGDNSNLKIPIYYTNMIGEQASTDLGKVLLLWNNMAQTNKYMHEIESSVNILGEALKTEKLISRDFLGNVITKEGQIVLKPAENSNLLSAFMDYAAEAVYGVNFKTNDKGVKLPFIKRTKRDSEGNPIKDEKGNVIKEEVIVSRNKGFIKLLSYTSSKTLGLNFTSAAVNVSGGIMNGVIEGHRDVFYNKSQFLKSTSMITAGKANPKAMTLLRYFDILGDMEIHNKANALSVSAMDKFFTYDKIYTLQKKGDSLIQNSILLSLLQSYGLNETGKIVHLRNLPENSKSLLDSAEIVNDELVIKGLTDVEDDTQYRLFRAKAHEISKNLIGQSPAYDIRLANQHLLGRALLQYRNWIPRMYKNRFGKEYYNESLQAVEEGRFRTFWNFMTRNLAENSISLLKTSIGLGVQDLNEKFTLEYEALSDKEKAKISKEDYVQTKIGNIKGALLEIQLAVGLFILMTAMATDDDDEKTALHKKMTKSLDRLFSEVSFFLLPTSFNDIVKKPIPLMGFIEDTSRLFGDTGTEIIGQVTGDDELIKKSKPMKYLLKTFPITNVTARELEIFYGQNYWDNSN